MSTLPVILVCANSVADANHIISEVVAGEEQAEGAGGAVVWRVRTKYYCAELALQPHADGAAPPAAPPAGLLLYLGAAECGAPAAAAVCERRARAAPAAAVRVLALDCAEPAAALRAWAASRRLAPVPLRAEGAAAVREALQAHPWPGRRPPPAAAAAAEDREPELDAWAAALGSLAPAAAAVRALSGAERLAAAESVLAAFCRAVGEDLDDL